MNKFRSVHEMRLEAEKLLSPIVNEYLNAGAGSEATLQNNRNAFKQWAFVPRRLKGVSHPDLSVTIFGKKYNLPFGAAPVGMQMLFHEDGEQATAHACQKHNALCILSTVSNLSYAKATKNCKVKPWFQLYPTDNFSVTEALVNNAVDAGAEVIVLTVDVPVLGNRKHNAKALLNHPDYKHLAHGNLKGILSEQDNIHYPGLNWNLLDKIKSISNCKVLVKGILHPEDAKKCVEYGVDGIIISNHGGRQLDAAISTIQALVKIKEVIPSAYPIFIDGGLRSAEDILKAILLGAKMAFLGRPICYGLAIGGQAGVDQLFALLSINLKRNMQLMGMECLSKFDAGLITRI